MANSRYYSSVALPTTLTASIGTSDAQISVASTFGFPLSLPYTLALDYGASNEELVQVTAVGGLVLDVTRAIDGTSSASHNPGAVVRHVTSARDFTDSRTHEASSTGVHGIVGAVVGTTDVQNLSGKTLTTANLASGGTINGTFSGVATFSGPITFSSNIAASIGLTTTNGAISVTRSTAGGTAYSAQVTGDSINRWNVLADGTMRWGPGGVGAVDSTLERAGVATLRATDTEVRSTRVTSTNNALSARLSTDVNDRFVARADGQILLGDGTAVPDVNLFRDSANVLRTNDSLIVDGSFTVSGVGQRLAAYKTSGTARTSTSLTIDPDLQVSVSANSVYAFEALVFVQTTDPSGDLALQVTAPAGTGLTWAAFGQDSTATAAAGSVITQAFSASSVGLGAITASILSVYVRGTAQVSATPGTLGILWARLGATGTVTVQANSHLIATRIA